MREHAAPQQAPEVDGALERLQALRARATGIDVRAFMFDRHRRDHEESLIAPLLGVTEEATAELARLEEGFDAASAPARDAENRALVAHVADISFTARAELRRTARELSVPSVLDRAEALAACERLRRKLRRALGHVMAALLRAAGRDAGGALERESDLESAISVRSLYARFRESLPTFEPDSEESVRRALRLAAVSLAVLTGSSDFAEVRMRDRNLLLQLQGRIFEWARGRTGRREGVALLLDLMATADLLRAINSRQELQAHDAAVVRACALELRSGEGFLAVAHVLAQLQSLRGRDDELDRHLTLAQRQTLAPDVVVRLQAILDRLSSGSMGASGFTFQTLSA